MGRRRAKRNKRIKQQQQHQAHRVPSAPPRVSAGYTMAEAIARAMEAKDA
jgi:hypothetical protein